MKKFYLLGLCLSLLLVYSCQFSETIHINDDGSGKMSFMLDGSQLMEMGGNDMLGADEEAIDSTVVFKDVLEEKKDSIATLPKAEQEQLKALENFKIHTVMDPKTQKMTIDMYTDFDNVASLEDMFKLMNNASDLKGKEGEDEANPFSAIGSGEATEVDYSFKNNVFKRKVTIVDPELLEATKDSIGDAEMILAASTYTLDYHFPKKIKSVSIADAKFSEDHKSFSVEVSFKDYLTNPESLNVEVVLED